MLEDEKTDVSLLMNFIEKKYKRDSYLFLTDKYLLPDYPITPEKLEIIKTYRQYLRDFMNNNTEALLNGEEIEIDPIPSL